VVRGVSLLAAIALVPFLGSCETPAETNDESAASAVVAKDGSIRLPFLRGAFVTYNRVMPIEVEQAIAGVPTKRPVVVWAGH
jgi:hypothetical protein